MSTVHHVMRVAPLLLAVFTTACASARSTPEPRRPTSGASVATTSGCGSGTRSPARVGRVALTFTGASSGTAIVRIEGVTTKSMVEVDIATGTMLELVEGEYQLRISAAGIRSATRSINVVCGKESTERVALTRG
jgi:hypothetical protein